MLVPGPGRTFFLLCAFLLFRIGFVIQVICQFARTGNLSAGLFAVFLYLPGVFAISGLTLLYLPLPIMAGLIVLILKIVSTGSADRILIVGRY